MRARLRSKPDLYTPISPPRAPKLNRALIPAHEVNSLCSTFNFLRTLKDLLDFQAAELVDTAKLRVDESVIATSTPEAATM